MKTKRTNLLALFLLAMLAFSCNEKEEETFGKQYTLNDLAGQWIWMYMDDQVIPTQRISIDSIGIDGKSSSMTGLQKETLQWERLNMTSSIKNNVLTNTYDNVSYSYKILSCSYSTLVVTVNGHLMEAKKLTAIYNGDILGTWEGMLSNGQQSEITFYNDGTYSSYYIDGNDTTSKIDGQYTLYGELLVRQAENHYYSSLISFGIGESGKYYFRTTVADSTSTIIVNTRYRKQLEYTANQFVGTWIWNSKNGKMLPYNDYIIDVNASDGSGNTYSEKDGVFSGNAHTYRVEEDKLIHNEDNVDYVYTIIYASINNIVVRSVEDNTLFSAYRCFDDFSQNIIGSWFCKEYSIPNATMSNVLFTFGEDKTVSFIADVDGKTVRSENGSYKLFGNYLVMNQDDMPSVATIIDINYSVEAGLVMKFIQDGENGININTLYKQILH